MNLYKIDGGIGKNISFTGIIDELVKKDGEQIVIETSYPDVFTGIDGVLRVYNSSEGKDPSKFYSYFNKVFASDPYVGSFFKGDLHLLNAWGEQLGVDIDNGSMMLPKLKLDIDSKIEKELHDKIGTDKYYIIQVSGGQSPYEFANTENPKYESNHMRNGRNIVALDALYDRLKKEFPDYTMVQFGLPNEPQIKDAVQLQTNYRNWFSIFSKAKFFVGIDSMMPHAMASFKMPGIVYWDMNTSKQFGWDYEGRFDYRTSLPNGVFVDQRLAEDSILDLKSFIKSKTGAVKEDVVSKPKPTGYKKIIL